MTGTDERWDRVWTNWDKPAWPEYTAIRLEWLHRTFSRLLVEHALLPEDLVIEMGAGSGWVTAALNDLFSNGEYICADISQHALNRLKQRQLPGVKTCMMDDIASLGAKARVVICGDVLEHVEDRATFLELVARTLRPEGFLLLTTPNRYVPIAYLNRLRGKSATGQPYDRPCSASEVVALLKSNGMNVLELTMANASRRPVIGPLKGVRKWVLRGLLAAVESWLALCRRDRSHAILVLARKKL